MPGHCERCWSDFAAAAAPALARWQQQIHEPEQTQTIRLEALIADNAQTEFGRAHGFESIRTLADFAARVPDATWADMAPWVERGKRSAESPLTREAPLFYERTSGSSAASKHIPYTPALLAEVQRALIVWLAQLYRDCPGVAAGRSYWTLSPSTHASELAPNGTPIGSASDATYVAGSIAALLLPTVLVPGATGRGTWRRDTLVALIEAEDLAFLSLWSPTFLTALLQPLLDRNDESHAQTFAVLHAKLTPARLRVLERALGDGNFRELWPRLAAISVWMDGPSAHTAAQLRALFPHATWCPKGLLATEGVVSFSWGASGLNPLAIDSHVLEFVDDQGALRGIGELRAGERYRPLISTGGGLYRYRLGDLVEVESRLERTPCVFFVGREDARCDLVGEKLDEALVSRALESVLGQHSGACLVPLPDASPQRYLILLPAALGDCAARASDEIETHLQSVFHYSHARRLGQLAPLASCSVASPSATLQRGWEATGARAGDAKPRALVTSLPQARAIARVLREHGAEIP